MSLPTKFIIQGAKSGRVTTTGKPTPITLWINDNNLCFEIKQDEEFIILDKEIAKKLLELIK